MRLPRDVSGDDLAEALADLGYRVTRQTGSHLRLTTTTLSAAFVGSSSGDRTTTALGPGAAPRWPRCSTALIESAKLCGVDPKVYLLTAARAALADRAAVTLPYDLLRE